MKVDLSKYTNNEYDPGNKFKIIIWYITNHLIFNTFIPFPSFFKVKILKFFGAKIGKNIVIKPKVNIKYPWFNCWIGEGVWIDNLAQITIGNNVCLSQNAYILAGSHNYKKEAFDLILGKILLEDGVWIGAKSIVCPGVICKTHSVLTVGSVATNDLEPYGVYQGNPAVLKRKRIIE